VHRQESVGVLLRSCDPVLLLLIARTPRKHPATPPMRPCDLVQLDLPGPSHHGNQQQPEQSSQSVDGISIDPEILESVINDTQLPQQLADSINAALHR